MGFNWSKEITLSNGKKMKIVYYWGFWLDLRFLQVDYESIQRSGYEIRQVLNGRIFQSSFKGA